MFDLKWCQFIDRNKPTLITARGVFEYFEVDEIVKLLINISKEITRAEIVFDTPNSKAIGYTNRYVKKSSEERIKPIYQNRNANGGFKKNGKNYSFKTIIAIIAYFDGLLFFY